MPDSLVANWLIRPLAIASAAAVGGTGSTPTGGLPTTIGSTTSSTTAPPSSSLKPMKIGVNLMSPRYYVPTRAFMNLASDGGWRVTPKDGSPASSYFDANRNVVKVLPGDNISRFISRPTGVYQKKSVDVICRWDGVGTLQVSAPGGVRNVVMGANNFRYTQTTDASPVPVYLKATDATNYVRNFDCREVDADRNALFDPAFIAHVKRFTTIRFMDWQNTPGNKPVTWATRTTPAMGQIMGDDGVAIENMIELANQTHTNPWFCVAWNSDDDYVRKFAELVRDRLDPSLKAYVEVSNEVWNYGNDVSHQAQSEGLSEGLTTNAQKAVWMRYAEKTIQVMDIWRDVFAGQSSRLVRVAATQNAWIAPGQTILSFRDTAQHIDAIATAPYFDYSMKTAGTDADLGPIFTSLKTTLDSRFEAAKLYKQLADQYGLRFITYEAGQHVYGLTGDEQVPLLDRLEHDPRMGQLYTYYLTRWNNEIGDLMVLFNDIDNTSKFGSWGLLDNIGQTANATPKSKAVLLYQTSVGK